MKPQAAVASLVMVVVFLGLAILGWGSFSAYFAHPARIAVSIITVLLTIAGIFSAASISAGEREDRSNRWVLVVFIALGLIGAYVPALTDRIEVWTLDGDAVRWLGVGVYLVGGIVRLWPVFVLGRRFSGLVAIQSGHTLETGGIYGLIRHPSYLGLLVVALGWALAFRSGPGVLLAALNLVPLVARINAEEALLRSEFGAEYEAYCQRTSRLVPGIY